ncbi:MAG: branched-chain amino acid ABC transporter substrate-binding protein, partial [Mesorhizobium sp.]
MTSAVPGTLAAFLCLFSLTVNVTDAPAQETTAKPEKKITEIKIGYLRAYAPQLTLSLLDLPPRDEGVAGANVAIGDNNTTGKFTNQKFSLDVTEIKPEAGAVQAFNDLIAKGDRYVVADLPARQLLSIADIARDKGVLIFNVGATDDSLREDDCRINIFHVAPTRSMLADALAQYLVVKKWSNWVLLYGSHEQDHLYADALRRAAARFGGQIVAEKEFKDTGTARRTDTGATQIQQQISVFTQDMPEHDVLL